MGNTADKLNKLLETKQAIKTAIINKGVEVSESDTFSSYADKINNISSSGGDEIEVINNTGRTIEVGDKVWINKNGNNYELVSYLKNIVFGSNTVVGSPTINQSTGVVNNFSTSNYIETLKFRPQHDTFDIYIKIRTANDVSTLQLFLGNGGYYDRCWGGIDGGHFLWNLNDSNSFSAGIGTITGYYNVLPNTDYYLHLSFNGTQYILEYSLDGINYVLDGIINSSTIISDADYPLTLGANHYIYDVNYPFFGDIDLTQCFIDIDSKRYWYGATVELNINEDSQTGVALENIPNSTIGNVRVGAVIRPTGSITITTNGTHDVAYYSEAIVNVPVSVKHPDYDLDV